ncbi:MAG: ThuA domain-containing protein [Candidatus Onthomonas sp.]
MAEHAGEIRAAQEGGTIHDTLKRLVEEAPDVVVCHIATLEMPECGLTEQVLEDTDVLIWWSHIAQEQVPFEIAARVRDHVQRGMGVIFLHSAHLCRPMQLLLGTSCTLRWRENDCERLWCCNPAHPIAKNVPVCVWLEHEEMYGEYFDIPKPDELVFIGGFDGGEVFRAGCVWNRGWGKVFYFQPGHETCRSYFNPHIRKIIQNAVQYLADPEQRQEKIECLSV